MGRILTEIEQETLLDGYESVDHSPGGVCELDYMLGKQDLKTAKLLAEEIFDFLKTKNLMVSEVPVEGKHYQFLGCYILKWGKTDEPTLGLTRLGEDEEYLAFKSRFGGK